MSQSGTDMMQQFVVKPAINAGLAYIVNRTMGYQHESLGIPFYSGAVSSNVVAAIGAGAASVGAEITHNFLFPHILPTGKYAEATTMVFHPAVNGALYYASLMFLSPHMMKNSNGVNLVIQGAGVEVGSSYVFEKIVAPWMR